MVNGHRSFGGQWASQFSQLHGDDGRDEMFVCVHRGAHPRALADVDGRDESLYGNPRDGGHHGWSMGITVLVVNGHHSFCSYILVGIAAFLVGITAVTAIFVS